jgi:hypothetical protein
MLETWLSTMPIYFAVDWARQQDDSTETCEDIERMRLKRRAKM